MIENLDFEIETKSLIYRKLYVALGSFLLVQLFVGLILAVSAFVESPGHGIGLKQGLCLFLWIVCSLAFAMTSFDAADRLTARRRWNEAANRVIFLCLCVPFGLAIGIPCLIHLSKPATRSYMSQDPIEEARI